MRRHSHEGTSLLLLPLFMIISATVFAPSFNRGFVSDDYCILDFLINTEGYLVKGFFRPVGDLTLKLTYLFAGADASVFYVVNALLHGFNAWLLYIFCLQLVAGEDKTQFPFIAAVLFLFYHSIGEVVLWTIGRGISLAVTFSMLALIAFMSRMKTLPKYVVVCVCYFIALSAYESVLLLPVVILVMGRLYRLRLNYVYWIAALGTTLLANLLLRVAVTGKLWASYKGVIWAKSLGEYAASGLKSLLRLFIPAFNQPMLFAFLGVLAIALLIGILVRKRYAILKENTAKLSLIGILTALLIVMFYGASTRTSEGDRLLYWPAVFLSMLAATIIVRVAAGVWRIILVVAVSLTQLFFLVNTQLNWIEADRLSKVIIKQLTEKPERPLYIINLPSEHSGAYMFRNCFNKALQFHGIDDQAVHVVNQLNFAASENWPGMVAPSDTAGGLPVGPATRVYVQGDSVLRIETQGRVVANEKIGLNHVVYWNKDSLVELSSVY